MLIGISLGPGDPDLLTFKAADALRKSDKVFVPGGMAADLARPFCRFEPELLDFPMIDDKEKLEEVWRRNAEKVIEHAKSGSAAFACIGDVNTFSTFTRLKRVVLRMHPEIRVETIPGVGVLPALASRFGIALDRSFQVTDGSEIETVIRMKAVRPKKAAEELRNLGFDRFILGVRLCTPDERIIRDEMPERSDYFSVLYAGKSTGEIGSREDGRKTESSRRNPETRTETGTSEDSGTDGQ